MTRQRLVSTRKPRLAGTKIDRGKLRRWFGAGALGCALLGGSAATVEAQPSSGPAEVARARVVAGWPGHHLVREVRRIQEGGGRLDWLRQGDWLAFDKLGADGRFAVYLLQADQTGSSCLTCEIRDFRGMNVFNPTWHPSGEFLVVQVQSHAKQLKLDVVAMATPYRSLHSELWVLYRDGRDYYQITHASDTGGAVLDAHFSHEADRLAWSERLTTHEPPWGEWAVRVAELKAQRGVRLGKVRTYRPSPGGLVMVHGFAPDDRSLELSTISGPGLPDTGLDVQIFDLETATSDRLTTSPDERDLLLSHVPHADEVVWVTDRGIPRSARPRLPWRGDLWLRSLSGVRQERLTYFNDPGSEHYLGQALVGDLAWSADGRRLAIQVVYFRDDDAEAREAIYMLELGDEPPG